MNVSDGIDEAHVTLRGKEERGGGRRCQAWGGRLGRGRVETTESTYHVLVSLSIPPKTAMKEATQTTVVAVWGRGRRRSRGS